MKKRFLLLQSPIQKIRYFFQKNDDFTLWLGGLTMIFSAEGFWAIFLLPLNNAFNGSIPPYLGLPVRVMLALGLKTVLVFFSKYWGYSTFCPLL